MFAYHGSFDEKSGPSGDSVVATRTRQDLSLSVTRCRAHPVCLLPALSSSVFFSGCRKAYCSARVGCLLAGVGKRNVWIRFVPRMEMTPLNRAIRCDVRGNEGMAKSNRT